MLFVVGALAVHNLLDVPWTGRAAAGHRAALGAAAAPHAARDKFCGEWRKRCCGRTLTQPRSAPPLPLSCYWKPVCC